MVETDSAVVNQVLLTVLLTEEEEEDMEVEMVTTATHRTRIT